MGSFLTPRFAALDTNGDPVSGAKLNFYVVGTSTPQDTYSDKALTSANANPVVADGNGLFGEIFLKTDASYKVQLTDSSDVQIWEEDDVDGAELVSASLRTRVKQIASNPLDYGAIGDGAADESSEVQSAIDDATGVVDLLGKTFRCDSEITLDSSKSIVNGTLDFSSCNDASYISLTGTRETTTLLTGDAADGATSVAVTSASGFSAGDYAYITSTDNWSSDGNNGEIVLIKTVSGLTITFDSEIHGGYLTASGASLGKLTPKTKAALDGVTVIGSSSQTSNESMLLLNVCQNVRVKNCTFSNMFNRGIYLRGCVDVEITGCRFTTVSGGNDKGVDVSEASRDTTIRDCRFASVFTPVLLGTIPLGSTEGVVRGVVVDGCRMDGCGTGLDIRANSHLVRVSDNVILPTTSGITSSSFGVDISGNHISGGSAYGITLVGQSATVTGYEFIYVRNNSIVAANDTAIYALSSGAVRNFEISGNRVISATVAGIDVVASSSVSSYENLVVSNNMVDDCPVGIRVVSSHASASIANVSVSGNQVNDCTAAAITVQKTAGSINRALVSGNSIYDGTTGIFIDDVVTGVVAGNSVVLAQSAADGIVVTSSFRVSVTGNTVDTGPNGDDGVALSGTSIATIGNNLIFDGDAGISVDITSSQGYMTIAGNSISQPDEDGIKVTTGSNSLINLAINGNSVAGVAGPTINLDGTIQSCVVSGNTLQRTNDSGPNIDVDGDSASAITFVSFSGNAIVNGTYGIDVANVGVCIHDGNVFGSLSTGNTTGTFTTAGDTAS